MTPIWLPSPNFDSRDGCDISLLVLHYTGMKTASDALERLCNLDSKVSAHYVVDEDGTVYHLVKEEMRAWHAGVSSWRGESRVNHHSIGIEIVNPGHEFGYRNFPEIQMLSVVELCKDILVRHDIPPRNVVGHSDVAPSRKEDPGELFDWEWLAREDIGIMPQPHLPPAPIMFISAGNSAFVDKEPKFEILLDEGMQGDNVFLMRTQLHGYGYAIEPSEFFDNSVTQVVEAFQRHFRRHNIDGVWDLECHLAIEDLLNKAHKG